MALGARWFFGRKGRVPHAVTIGGAVLWPKGQGPPHLIRASSRGLCVSGPGRGRSRAPDTAAASGSLVPSILPNMGHLTNGRLTLPSLYSSWTERYGGRMLPVPLPH